MKLGSKTFRKTLVKPISVSNPGSGKKKMPWSIWIKKDFIWGGNKESKDYISKPKSGVTWSNQQNQLSKIRFVSENLRHMATNMCQ